MDKIHQQDLYQIQNAKRKVQMHIAISYLILCLSYGLLFYLYSQEFMKGTQTDLFPLIFGMAIGELGFYGLLMIGLAKGNKILRIFFWICFLLSSATIYFPIQYIWQDYSNWLPYFVLACWIIIKSIYLFRQGMYYHNNFYSKIYFDHILEVEENLEPVVRTSYSKTKAHPIHKPKEQYEEEQEEEKEFTYPQLSIRLGICIFASLILFPALIQIFSGFFESMDMQKVFATKEMFILTILSAMIWTIPIFYLYYDHPQSKKIIYGCMIAELVRILFFIPKLYAYFTTGDYPIRVFILFILMDVIRYIFLYISIHPIFHMIDDSSVNQKHS